MHSGTTWRLGHRPALDGLRGVAILLVIVNHIDLPGGHDAGQVGVGAFFVLSGFLITSLLLERASRDGRVRFGAFYARRALRLGPALLVCVAVTWSFASFAGVPVGPSPWAALLYVMDFVQAGSPLFQPGLFSHTWSLGIEEQFYLLWPLALVALLRVCRVSLTVILAGIAVALAGWTVWLSASGAPLSRILYAPDTRAAGLIAGCALAVAFAGRPMPVLPRPVMWAALVTLPCLAFAPNYGVSDVAQIVLTVPVSVVLVWACVDGGVIRALSPKWLRMLGERSYGVYLWHFPLLGIVYFAAPGADWWLRAMIALSLTAAAVELSWRYVEQPLLSRGVAGVRPRRSRRGESRSGRRTSGSHAW